MAKADKLLYLVNLIKSNHNLNAKQLAEKFGVSERTIFRYINSLASASLPIYYDHGYKFLDSAFLPTLNLTDAELSTLKFAFEFSPIKSDPLLVNTANSILAKLETSRKNSYAPNESIRSEKPPGSSPSKNAEATSPSSQEIINFFMIFRWISQSINQKKMAKVKYKKQELLIEPYGLVQKNSTWLILCNIQDSDQMILLDISRIEKVSLTNQTFESKLDLDRLLTVPP
jgi:predicted DNA-binding transcriptional regulator YafY